MTPNAYRKKVEQEVEAARAQAAGEKAPRAAMVAKRTNDPESRRAAIAALGDRISKDDALFSSLLSQLSDPTEDASVRSAILTAIQAQTFLAASFQSRRPAWLAALRGLIEDPDPELRLQALGILSNEKDGLAQQVLLRGLREPVKALVPPEKALQLLSNDIHADVYPLARAIVANPPSEAARLEALRVLGADADSVQLLEGIARDRKESPEARRLAIAALTTLAPVSLRKHAREIVLTEDEDPEVLATSLAALARDSVAAPAELAERVALLRRSGSPEVRSAAKRLHEKLSP